MNKNSAGGENDIQKVINAGCRILSYASNTEKQLRVKLKKHGFSPELIDEAVEYFKEKRYIDDEAYVERAAEYFAGKKKFGVKRIKTELMKMGFSSEHISNVSFDEIDFIGNCGELLLKRGGRPDEKTIAALMRHGYSLSEIKTAYKQLK